MPLPCQIKKPTIYQDRRMVSIKKQERFQTRYITEWIGQCMDIRLQCRVSKNNGIRTVRVCWSKRNSCLACKMWKRQQGTFCQPAWWYIVEHCFSTFVRLRPGKFFFHKTRAQSQQIYSSVPFQFFFLSSYVKLTSINN